jgi:hypothetical protein
MSFIYDNRFFDIISEHPNTTILLEGRNGQIGRLDVSKDYRVRAKAGESYPDVDAYGGDMNRAKRRNDLRDRLIEMGASVRTVMTIYNG